MIESAEYRSAARASLVLRVDGVVVEGVQRRASRVALNVQATLTARVCDRIPPGERIAVGLVDVSDSGIAVTAADDRLRTGDRMLLTARFLEGPVVGEVRIARVGSTPTEITAGCFFLDPAEVAPVLERVLARLVGESRPAADR